MRIERQFTVEGRDVYDRIAFRVTRSEQRNPSGEVVFRCRKLEVPEGWSQVAADILAQHFLRRSGVPARLRRVPEEGVPEFLWRSVADEAALSHLTEARRFTSETSARQMFDRLAGAWAYWGWKAGYFTAEADARAYHDEMRHMLALQMAAPDAAQCSQTGLHWAYGIDEAGRDGIAVDLATGELRRTDSLERPEAGGVAILSMPEPEDAPDMWSREAGLVRAGVRYGVNVATPPAGPAGMMAQLDAGDRLAGLAQGKGSVRRPARLALCDADHPEASEFIEWKSAEAHKLASLTAGSHLISALVSDIRLAFRRGGPDITGNPALQAAIRAAKRGMVPDDVIQRTLAEAVEGRAPRIATLEADWDGKAAATVSGARTATAIRLSDTFMRAATKPATRAGRERRLQDRLARAVWATSEPGALFGDTINGWNTCAQEGGIDGASLDGDFMFLSDTAAMPATLNLRGFLGQDGFRTAAFSHAARLWVLTLDLSLCMMRRGDVLLAARSQEYRPLALGHANAAGLLMAMGLGYATAEGRAMVAAITALMTGTAYAASAELAGEKGAFPAWSRNARSMLRVVKNHRRAAEGEGAFEGLGILPYPLDADCCPQPDIVARARLCWDDAVAAGAGHGFRHAQVTALRRDPVTDCLLDCDTSGIAPASALIRWEPSPEGQPHRALAAAVDEGLAALGHPRVEIAAITAHVIGHGSLENAPGINHTSLLGQGLGAGELARVEAALGSATHIRFALTPWTLGLGFCREVLGLPAAQLADPAFDLLAHLGFSPAQIAAANTYVFGTGTLHGAPFLKAADLHVFHCLDSTGEGGVDAACQIHMIAAAQPFVSGGIGGVLRLPATAAASDCLDLQTLAWSLGLKGITLSRDRSQQDPALAAVLEEAEESLALPDPAAATQSLLGRNFRTT
ncbi:ribonucleotide-diphosphate reductase subunit alpha [Haematobacter missouriensis]|uniref:Ribonucleotide-diphosphate reductase subunit alpha n=1 Tax=Haematobacter missouriensis TaxID=366616 RepID=A0A212AJR1_9RHOB|nr:YebC/PmpR family DNA-binding transcriptional regulator [Haematobacter missouriensis]KFI32557.1 ribonucleotide-diphosphate reductase subunit alpha [Haematobacter missouriensis]OWJ70208.1 ribonucleotide-diphosphate reductase subunit alpha [Haematobacter missouriensis]OWJ81724.1 ribonucleotide-diphosphate reductase subunit alpha [Haematobacter missouriensis]